MQSFNKQNYASVFIVVLFVLFLSTILSVYIYFGYTSYKNIEEYIEDGQKSVNNERYEIAIRAFQNAEKEFTYPVKLFLKLSRLFYSKADLYSLEDIYELISTSALAQAYEDMFTLNPATKWLEIAQNYLNKIYSKNVDDLKLDIKTAQELSKLCLLIIEKNYEEVLKKLLEIEKKARPNDLDFFIIEMRILIACGKALNDNDILHKARELLFFATYEAQINNKKIDLLWGILNK